MLIRESVRGQYEARDYLHTHNVSRHADGSCLIRIGKTQVVTSFFLHRKDATSLQHPQIACTVSADQGIPDPFSTLDKSLQAVLARLVELTFDKSFFEHYTFSLQAHVLHHDGSLFPAVLESAFASIKDASQKSNFKEHLRLKEKMLAISCGLVKGHMLIDLDQDEEQQADALACFCITEAGRIIFSTMISQKSLSSTECVQLTELALHCIKKIQRPMAA